MVSDPGSTKPAIQTDEEDSVTSKPTVLLFMQPGRDRELLVDTFSDRYRIETTTDVEALDAKFDCCIFDIHEFNRVAGTVQSRRDTSRPVFLPFVLLVGESELDQSEQAWDYVDDIIELPVKKAALHARLNNLIERRQTAARLADREAQLEETVADLRLKEQAMDEAPVGITITETQESDNPIIYANEQFKEITGFSSNVLGEDCRFLQGEQTDPATTATIRDAIDRRKAVSVDILNYRKNGEKFWNKLEIAPIDESGEAGTNFVGFQIDITDRKIKELRLEVLNRVLSHNLRNKMNIIEGYAELLTSRYDSDETPTELDEIKTTSEDLLGLAEAVQKAEMTLETVPPSEPIDLVEQVEGLISSVQDRYPAAQIELNQIGTGPCKTTTVGLLTAIEEAIENAIKHNDDPDPSVEMTIEHRSGDWVEIEIVDNGPGIPARELEVLKSGETSLKHADRLGLWLMYWVVSKAGGEFSIGNDEADRTKVTFSIPTRS